MILDVELSKELRETQAKLKKCEEQLAASEAELNKACEAAVSRGMRRQIRSRNVHPMRILSSSERT